MDRKSTVGGSGNAVPDKYTILEGVIQNLLDGLADRDESVRLAMQSSLVKIMEAHPLRASEVLSAYREKHPKLQEETMCLIVGALESVVSSNANIPIEAYQKFVSIAVDELTRSVGNHSNPTDKQHHAKNILVAVGRVNCLLVMNALISHTKDGEVAHYMIMQCLGTLATANVQGVVPHIKQILSNMLPQLTTIKLDVVKQAHAFAIGHFCEALLEHSSAAENNQLHNESKHDGNKVEQIDCATEISVAYDVLSNHWLQTREQTLCVEILQGLSNMYPLLPKDKVQDQVARLIPQILALYRRSIDRNAITLYLSAVLKTNIALRSSVLDGVIDQLLSNLFDLVCVYPDYEKPQTVKGHYEVLRCFCVLSNVYAEKILDMLLIHLRNNSERERIKSLLILTHLINTKGGSIESKLPSFIECLKQLIYAERSIKMKMTLLKTIVALAQKSLLNKDKEFVYFIVRYSCKFNKINQEYGSLEEHANFVISCKNALHMLSTTVGVMDELLKRELLNYFVLLDYTDICSNLAKCLSILFAKSANIEYEVCDDDVDNAETSIKSGKLIVPSAEIIFARCLALLGNYHCIERASHILSFLKYYYVHLNPELNKLWDKRIPDLLLNINKDSLFSEQLREFIIDTVEFLNTYDEHYAVRLVKSLANHNILYPHNLPTTEFVVPQLQEERNMLLKAIALTLCSVTDVQIIHTNIDLIITSARQEKLDKHTKHTDYERRISDAALSLGYISRMHLPHLLKRLAELANIGGRKQSTGFFSNFIKDAQKELETYKVNILVIKAFGCIMNEADPLQSLQNLDDTLLNFLIQQLTGAKDQTMMCAILKTLVSICEQIIATKNELTAPLKYRKQIMDAVFSIPIEAPYDDLPLLPTIIMLGTYFIRIGGNEATECEDGAVIFEIACKNFFNCAQHLKMKFDSPEEDDRNSFLAKYLNESLPELNALVKVIIATDASPSTLDLLLSILECWTRDRNSEVRICVSHVYNNILEVYIKSMKIGCEAPSKFNQTGQMLGKIVPRCIDSNATVRQVSVEILQKTLEISCIYETLTIADSETDWMKSIELIKEDIITDDPKKIYVLAGDIAKIIAAHISNFHKTLLLGLNDPEQSSAIGASVVLKFFVQQKGSELFHAIPDIVRDSLISINHCEGAQAKTGVLKALVALTKHHPKLVCSEMLNQQLPFDENVLEYWHLVCADHELIGTIIENFLHIITGSCLYEPNEALSNGQQKIACFQPFAIFCALREIMKCTDIKDVLNRQLPELFIMFITSLATYTNVAAPMQIGSLRLHSPTNSNSVASSNASLATVIAVGSLQKSKFGFIPNKEIIKLNPCQIVLEALQAFLKTLEMEDVYNVLLDQNKLANSSDLRYFIDLLQPLANALVHKVQINSKLMQQLVIELSKYVSSPYDDQRIAAVGLFSRLIPLKPIGEACSNILTHLGSALSDPNATVRGLSIQAFGYIGDLKEYDIENYTEIAISSLLKGIDDTESESLINTPLESMRGFSRVLKTLPNDRVETFHVSLAIRIRPFFGSNSLDIREAAIILFGDLCASRLCMTDDEVSSSSTEALREQLYANLFPLLLHLSESETIIIKACKGTLREVCALLNVTKVNEMAQRHLLDHGQLNYSNFIHDLVKIIAAELPKMIQDFIDTCVPQLRSQWPEVRGSAAIVIGILQNYLSERNGQTELVGYKISALLKDENHFVRSKAATALGYFYGEL